MVRVAELPVTPALSGQLPSVLLEQQNHVAHLHWCAH
jgi:hypothetical protein